VTEASDIPGRPLPVSARAPGKCIVFGEHAVVHGAPELLFAIDLYGQVMVRPGPETRLNAEPLSESGNAYFRAALTQAWADGPPIEVRSVSRIPHASGLGSSAAFVAELTAAFGAVRGGISRSQLAQRSYDVERGAQGVGSPGDTSSVVAGGYVTLNAGTGEALWSVRGPDRAWDVRRVVDPGWIWIVAYTGVARSTRDAVRAVGERLARPDGSEILARFAEVATDGIRAVSQGDRPAAAALMGRNQELLREVGVSHPRIEALLDAVRPASEGAKLTGAGAGGSVVVLPIPGRETEAVRRLARAGGLPFVVRPSSAGVTLVQS
jgi:mevalonate kinase